MNSKPRFRLIVAFSACIATVAVAILRTWQNGLPGCRYCENAPLYQLQEFIADIFGTRARCRYPDKNACISNLRQLDGAKVTWALENKKEDADTPTFKDLIGTNAYIRDMPMCPHDGVYSLGRVQDKPKCSHEGHTL